MNGLTVNAPHGEKDTEARFGFQVAPLYKDSEGIPRHLAVLLFFLGYSVPLQIAAGGPLPRVR